MYERCLSEAERVLAAHKEVVVTVKTVWHEVVRHSKRQKFEVPSIADFTTMLEADDRFEFVPSHQSVVETVGLPQDDQDVEELELESLGFFGEDRVKLKKVNLVGEFDKEETGLENGDESGVPSHSAPGLPQTLTASASRIPGKKAGNLSKNRTRRNRSSAQNRKQSRRKNLKKTR
ncbi:MAG TPA: hypothetical protein VI704_08375 [Bacteroidota bacterium]|nr:hypothetical protein [Bacteroidota bacterium]